MVLHCSLLIVQGVIVTLTNIRETWLKEPTLLDRAWVFVPLIEMVLQLLICYICSTLGASDQLQRFDCYLIEDGQGNFFVMYKLKDDVPQSIGEAYQELRGDGEESDSA